MWIPKKCMITGIIFIHTGCPADFSHTTPYNGDTCFKLVQDTPVNQATAESICNGLGGNLVAIPDEDTFLEVQGLGYVSDLETENTL